METGAKVFSKKVRAALQDEVTRGNYRRALDGFALKRKEAFRKLPEYGEGMRDEAYAIRMNSLVHHKRLMAELEKNLKANGINVHHAKTSRMANEIAERLCREHNVQKVVKGKSMITEELHLNAHLEGIGIEVVETDLGEYIIQLAKERPAHIVAPVIHKNKEQIAAVMADELGPTLKNAEAETLTLAARMRLREDFYSADAGISGVNFAVAETGTLCLVENEGNGRLTTTIPRLHIAFMSIEKVIARFSDIPLLYELLTRSASGQAITTYFNMISGPRGGDEVDGPAAVHVVILDNGRSRLLKDPLLRKTLLCIRCGACLNSCPIYINIGGHAYDAVIPGPIGKILMPQIEGMQRYGHLAGGSSLCGACVDVCPVKVPITEILLELRHRHYGQGIGEAKTLEEKLKSGGKRLIFWCWSIVCSHPWLYNLSNFFLTRLGNVLIPLMPWMPLVRQWVKTRQFPQPGKETFLALIKKSK